MDVGEPEIADVCRAVMVEQDVVRLDVAVQAPLGMRGVKANEQQKMMMYLMPAMMLIFFFSMASGLNLYYFIQNLASLPQQWLIAKERAKMKPRVSGTPISLFLLPSVARVVPMPSKMLATISFVVVLPALPVMPTTGPEKTRRCSRAIA